MFRFAGFTLDPQRSELRGPDGEAIKLRPKTFDMLKLFVDNAGRVLSKQELMQAVWPNIPVGDASLFQCIREIRTALGDERRQMIKLVSGRGYLFDAEVSGGPAPLQAGTDAPSSAAAEGVESIEQAEPAVELAETRRSRFGWRGTAVLVAVAGAGAILGLAIAAPMFGPDPIFRRAPPVIAVMPIAGSDPQTIAMAAAVTDRLVDGLAKIDPIRVVAPGETASGPQAASASVKRADFVVSGELQKNEQSWTLQARMIRSASSEVVWTAPVSVAIDNPDATNSDLQLTRLAAAIGHPLALRINALMNSGATPAAADGGSPAAKVVIEQATASINQTSRERFAAAQTMLEKALADDPDNVDLEVALAALQLRGIQMVWYGAAESAAVEEKAKSMLEHALRARPDRVPVLEAYCRFLTATNQFVDSLVACARALSFDPWNGLALYHIGLAQVQLGRFEDALATFQQADRFDTPQVSRWTWLLGAGWANMLMGRNEEALPWLQRSIAITPASGRTHMLVAAAYQQLGRPDEAGAALQKGLELRPGSTATNVKLPSKNTSPVFQAQSDRIAQVLIAAGLPER